MFYFSPLLEFNYCKYLLHTERFNHDDNVLIHMYVHYYAIIHLKFQKLNYLQQSSFSKKGFIIYLLGVQAQLLSFLRAKVSQPIVLVLVSGDAIYFEEENADAILQAWFVQYFSMINNPI